MDGVLHDDSGLRSCPDCGLMSVLPPAAPGSSIHCPRCHKSFRRVRSSTFTHLISYSVAALVFCVLAAIAPFIRVTLYGRFQVSSLWTGPHMLQEQNLEPLAMVVIFTTLVLPVAELVLMNIVLLGPSFGIPATISAHAFRWVKKMALWAMLEVYLLGFLVAYKRLSAMTYVHIDTAVYALILAIVFTALMETELDSEDIWRRLGRNHAPQTGDDAEEWIGCDLCFMASKHTPGSDCPRCGHTLHVRKKNSLEHTWAYVIAAALCYIPANYFPVMNITQLSSTTSYTIIGGMMEFWDQGFLPLALLIFVASILIPLSKIVMLVYMLDATRKRSSSNLLLRTRIYRLIRFIGRWSMVDIFMASIMVALVQFGQIANITSGIGGVYFCAVVIFTMLAVESFDARLMWDSAEEKILFW